MIREPATRDEQTKRNEGMEQQLEETETRVSNATPSMLADEMMPLSESDRSDGRQSPLLTLVTFDEEPPQLRGQESLNSERSQIAVGHDLTALAKIAGRSCHPPLPLSHSVTSLSCVTHVGV